MGLGLAMGGEVTKLDAGTTKYAKHTKKGKPPRLASDRYGYFDGGASFSGFAAELDCAAEFFHALADADQTEMTGGHRGRGVEAGTVVFDGEAHACNVGEIQKDGDPLGVPVFYGIGGGFLCDAEEFVSDQFGKTPGLAEREDLELATGGDIGDGRADGIRQGLRGERTVAQVPDETACANLELLDEALGASKEFAELGFLGAGRGGIEAQAHADEFLLEGIVKFAGDALALVRDSDGFDLRADEGPSAAAPGGAAMRPTRMPAPPARVTCPRQWRDAGWSTTAGGAES
jgi:hypothetical protein